MEGKGGKRIGYGVVERGPGGAVGGETRGTCDSPHIVCMCPLGLPRDHGCPATC